MAETKVTAATPATKAAPAAEANEAPKALKTQQQIYFPTAEAAIEEAKGRTKGRTRAFKSVWNGKEVYTVSYSEAQAGDHAFTHFGGKVEEIGVKAKAPKTLSPDAVMTVLNSLPEADRNALLEQFEKMRKASAPAAPAKK